MFAPRVGASDDELDGYYLTFSTSLDSDRTDLPVIDVAHLAEGPIAWVRMPHRVPNGLHGNWFPAR